MKNKAQDLRDHLFMQLERLGDESLEGEQLAEEIRRAHAVKGVAGALIDLAKEETDRLALIDRIGVSSGDSFMGQTEQRALGAPKD